MNLDAQIITDMYNGLDWLITRYPTTQHSAIDTEVVTNIKEGDWLLPKRHHHTVKGLSVKNGAVIYLLDGGTYSTSQDAFKTPRIYLDFINTLHNITCSHV